MLKENVNYKVKGYNNLWSVIDSYKGYCLLENNTWGDETCYLVVEEDVELIEKSYTKLTGEKVLRFEIQKVCDEIFDDFRTMVDEVYTFVPYEIL